MPTYAILGATGSTGSSLLRYLHERPDKVNLNVYARSASKLESMHPYVKDAQNIEPFIGPISDTKLLKDCLYNTTVIFMTVVQNANDPGCSVAREAINSIIAALELQRQESGADFQCPTVVFLSSASLNPHLKAQFGPVADWLLSRAIFYVYDDMKKAIAHLKENPWIPLIQTEPGGLVQDVSRGFKLSQEAVSSALGYEDLARAMVLMAEEGEGKRWMGQAVGVQATGKVQGSALPLLKYLATGMVGFYLPGVWNVCYGWLW